MIKKLYWSVRPGSFVNPETGIENLNGPLFTGRVKDWYETLYALVASETILSKNTVISVTPLAYKVLSHTTFPKWVQMEQANVQRTPIQGVAGQITIQNQDNRVEIHILNMNDDYFINEKDNFDWQSIVSSLEDIKYLVENGKSKRSVLASIEAEISYIKAYIESRK